MCAVFFPLCLRECVVFICASQLLPRSVVCRTASSPSAIDVVYLRTLQQLFYRHPLCIPGTPFVAPTCRSHLDVACSMTSLKRRTDVMNTKSNCLGLYSTNGSFCMPGATFSVGIDGGNEFFFHHRLSYRSDNRRWRHDNTVLVQRQSPSTVYAISRL